MTKRPKSAARPRHPDKERGGDSASGRAAALKAQWTRLARRHVLVGGSCACGHGQSHVRPEDFEYFVLDYLARKYRGSGQASLLRFLETGTGAASAGSLQSLLDRLVQPDIGRRLPPPEAALLMDDLQKSLDSFADSAL